MQSEREPKMWERILLVAALIAQAAVLAFFAFWAILGDSPFWTISLSAGSIASAVTVCALVLGLPERQGRPGGTPVLAAQAAIELYLIAVLVVSAVGDAVEVSDFGPNPSPLGFLVAITVGALILTLCVRALGRRPASVALLAAAGVLLVAGFASAAVGTKQVACSEFEFNRDLWVSGANEEDGSGEMSDRELIADALIRCDTLIGKSRDEVRRMLGKGSHGATQYFLGWTNDATGPGDEQDLTLSYDRSDRVRSAGLLYPE